MSKNKTVGLTRQEVIAGKKGGLGAFGGVFTPSILTILGVIMYLRFGWVVGNVGLLGTLLIVTMSTSITFLTALSISQIATDQIVRGGGAYYMISRSLGVELGGAIGIPLYLAQGLSIALYIVGFSESVVSTFPHVDPRLISIVTTILITLLVLFSTDAAIKSQYFIMVAIGISLFSLAFGRPIEEAEIVMWNTVENGSAGFWPVFAVFFPAVTGIMAGVNMSGDLENPNKSIPKGTFAAISVGYVIYMILPILLSMRVSADTLINDPLVMRKISWWGDAILLGVWGATLSSAVGSMLGAPRVLQALARDEVLPPKLNWLGRGSGPSDIPRLGTVLTAGITLIAVYFGDINTIGPVLTMFFLTTYAVLNMVSGVERYLGSPSFRPTFRVHWSLSLLGALGCIAVMILINTVATVIAFSFVIAIYIWLERRTLEAAWGDVRQGMWMAITRFGLMRLRGAPDAKNWRPHLLVLSGAPTRRWHLIDFASSITHNRALMTVSSVLTNQSITADRQLKIEGQVKEYLAEYGVQSMVRLIRAENPFVGAERLVDVYGIGALMPNTILLGDSEIIDSRERYCQMVRHFYENQRNTVIIAHNSELKFGNRQQIDVWWGGLKDNGALMMIMAYLLQTSLTWPNAQVRIRMVVSNQDAAESALSYLEGIIERIRIRATADVIFDNGRDFYNILHDESHETDIIFLGLAPPDENFTYYYENLRYKTRGLPTLAFVLAAEEIAFRDVLLQNE